MRGNEITQAKEQKMKAKEIEIGGRYIAKVSGKLVPVRVMSITKRSQFGSGRTGTRYLCQNEKTGRTIEVGSPMRFRYPAGVGMVHKYRVATGHETDFVVSYLSSLLGIDHVKMVADSGERVVHITFATRDGKLLRSPERFAAFVKDQSIGNLILEKIGE